MFISQIVTRATVFVKHSYIGCALEKTISILFHGPLFSKKYGSFAIFIMLCIVRICALPDLSCIKLNTKNVSFMLEPLSPPTAAQQKSKSLPDLLRVYPKKEEATARAGYSTLKGRKRRRDGISGNFFRYPLIHSASPCIDSSLCFRKAESFPHRISKRIIRKILFQKAAFLQQLEQRISRAIIFRSVHGKV